MRKRIFKIKPGDVLVSINDRHDPVSIIERWATGNPYEHVFVYLGEISLTKNLAVSGMNQVWLADITYIRNHQSMSRLQKRHIRHKCPKIQDGVNPSNWTP